MNLSRFRSQPKRARSQPQRFKNNLSELTAAIKKRQVINPPRKIQPSKKSQNGQLKSQKKSSDQNQPKKKPPKQEYKHTVYLQPQVIYFNSPYYVNPKQEQEEEDIFGDSERKVEKSIPIEKQEKHQDQSNNSDIDQNHINPNKMLEIKLKTEPEDFEEPMAIYCRICNNFFGTQSKFDDHLSTKHRPKIFKEYNCAHCKQQFLRSAKLIKHLEIHQKEFTCEECFKICNNRHSYSKHMWTHREPDLECEHCPKRFRIQRDLNRHQKTHFKQGYNCTKCDYETTVRTCLVSHLLNHEEEEVRRPFQCPDCEKRFAKADQLLEHHNLHTGEKPYTCDFCEEAFSLKRDLSTHCRKAHPETMPPKRGSKEGLTKCEECGAVLSSKRSLMRHKHSHNPTKVHLCDICGKSLTSYEHLTRHRRIHTGEKPYVCEMCSKAFSDPGNLEMHRRVHTKEKPYQCEFCPKAFGQRSTLTIHRRGHTGERPYECQLCNKKFVCQGNLTAHRKRSCITGL